VASRASPTGEEAVPFYSVDEKTATLVMWSGSGVWSESDGRGCRCHPGFVSTSKMRGVERVQVD
jgi:hypothetical protein